LTKNEPNFAELVQFHVLNVSATYSEWVWTFLGASPQE